MPDVTLEKLQSRLRQRKQELTERLAKIHQDVRASHSADWSEQAQERQNDEVMDALGQDARTELARVNHALARMEEGEYDICRNCGETIPLARLAAVPYTDLCIRCANQAAAAI